MKKSKYLFALALGASTLTFAQVGIGTSSPSNPLDIEATDAALDINNTAADGDPKINFQLNSTTTFSIGIDDTDDKFKIGTTAPDASTAVTVQSTGEVGIGTSTPGTDLHVNAFGDGFKVGNNAEAGMLYTTYEGVVAYLTLEENDDPFILRGIQADAADTAYLTFNNGNIGIGDYMVTPSSMLEILNTDATANAVEDMLTITKATSGSSAAGIGAGLIFEIEDGGNTEEQGRINVELDDVTNGSEDATMTFDINQNGTMTEIMRLDGTSGNVGIGTASPSTLLHIANDDATENAVEDMFTITKSTSGTPANGIGAGLIFEIEDGGSIEEQGRINVEMDDVTNTTEDATMTFDINQNGTMTEVMRIDGTSGYVGIGTSSPANELDVNGSVECDYLRVEKSGASVAVFDRTTNDGWILVFQQDGTNEGSISVAGSTISYNAFTGSHYAFSKDKTFERGMLVSFNDRNEHLHNNPESEILYGIDYTAKPNDSRVAGVFLNLSESTMEHSLENPYQIMAVGNGDVWVTNEGGNITTGDYLISSSVVGHAMKDNGDYEVSHVFAKATESVDWSTVQPDSNGVKRKKIIVYFESFDKPNYEKKFREQQAINEELKAELDSKTTNNSEEIEALKAQVQQLLQLIQQQESASVVK